MKAKLFILGTGPGDLGLLTPLAQKAIVDSTELVAYSLYLELLGDLCHGKTLHQLPLGEETERARLALNLAASGKTTALLSSGDAGIYAMATLVFELLDRAAEGIEAHPEWLQIDITVVPGVSAMQAAAASLGAALGHDFCAISLSDLLTPWETIEARLQAAALADFVVALYNPVSLKRRWQLERARDILLKHRPPETPVILGRNLTRPSQEVQVVALQDLQVDQVDMLTLVLIGNSTTRHLKIASGEWVYTPRGYHRKLTPLGAKQGSLELDA